MAGPSMLTFGRNLPLPPVLSAIAINLLYFPAQVLVLLLDFLPLQFHHHNFFAVKRPSLAGTVKLQ